MGSSSSQPDNKNPSDSTIPLHFKDILDSRNHEDADADMQLQSAQNELNVTHATINMQKLKIAELEILHSKNKTCYEAELKEIKTEQNYQKMLTQTIKINNERDVNLHNVKMSLLKKKIEEMELQFDNLQKLYLKNQDKNEKQLEVIRLEINNQTQELLQKRKNFDFEIDQLGKLYSNTKQIHEEELRNIISEINNQKEISEKIKLKNQKDEESHNKKIAFLKNNYQNIQNQIKALRSTPKSEDTRVKGLQNELSELNTNKTKPTGKNFNPAKTADNKRWLENNWSSKTIIDMIMVGEKDSVKDKPPNGIYLERCSEQEHLFVKNRFMTTTQSHFNIKSVMKVVNLSRMVEYALRKKEYQLLHGMDNVEEQWLFRAAHNYNLQYEYDRQKQDLSFPHQSLSFTSISNHAARRCNSQKLMYLAKVLTCKRGGKKDAHDVFCKHELEINKNNKLKPKYTYYKYREDEFYPMYIIQFIGDTKKKIVK